MFCFRGHKKEQRVKKLIHIGWWSITLFQTCMMDDRMIFKCQTVGWPTVQMSVHFLLHRTTYADNTIASASHPIPAIDVPTTALWLRYVQCTSHMSKLSKLSTAFTVHGHSPEMTYHSCADILLTNKKLILEMFRAIRSTCMDSRSSASLIYLQKYDFKIVFRKIYQLQ